MRQEDFFYVDTNPAITFRSRRVDVKDRTASRYTVVGDPTVRGVTREVTLCRALAASAARAILWSSCLTGSAIAKATTSASYR